MVLKLMTKITITNAFMNPSLPSPVEPKLLVDSVEPVIGVVTSDCGKSELDAPVIEKSNQHIQSSFAKEAPALTAQAIHARADTVPPVLEEILHSRRRIRWGINE